jgi:hypothetical protein
MANEEWLTTHPIAPQTKPLRRSARCCHAPVLIAPYDLYKKGFYPELRQSLKFYTHFNFRNDRTRVTRLPR